MNASNYFFLLVGLQIFENSFAWLFGSSETKDVHIDMPVILWWHSDLFPHVENDDGYVELKCPNEVSCLTTPNRQALKEDTRLVSIMLYGTDFRAYEAPLPRLRNHLWALVHEESPLNNHMLCHDEIASLFNFSSTFKRHSDFPITTQHFPSLEFLTSRKPVPLSEKNKLRKEGLAPVVYLQSHCDVPSDRDRYVKELMKHIDVDSYGACLNNKDLENRTLWSTETMHDPMLYDVLAKYKFNLAFENALCEDYITEKLVRALHVGSVPVYRGAKSIKDWAPERHSIINADDFVSPENLAELLNALDHNDGAYDRYLVYRQTGVDEDSLLYKTMKERTWNPKGKSDEHFFGSYECYVCEQMHLMQANITKRQEVTPRMASPKALSCPQPKPSVGKIADISPQDTFRHWIDDYRHGLDQARALEDMLKDEAHDPEMLWSYIEKRYDVGQGAFSHEEL